MLQENVTWFGDYMRTVTVEVFPGWSNWIAMPGVSFVAGTQFAIRQVNLDLFDVYAVGSDGQVWTRQYNSPNWGNWYSLGAPPGTSFPARAPISLRVLTQGATQVGFDLFVVALDNQVKRREYRDY